MATFSDRGTVPVEREEVIMEVTSEMIESRHALTRVVGSDPGGVWRYWTS